MSNKFHANSLEGKPHPEWQPFDKHLKNVAEKARSFAEAVGAARAWVTLQQVHNTLVIF